jgi:hypothetical protein
LLPQDDPGNGIPPEGALTGDGETTGGLVTTVVFVIVGGFSITVCVAVVCVAVVCVAVGAVGADVTIVVVVLPPHPAMVSAVMEHTRNLFIMNLSD